MHWYLDVLKQYATFSGRARRKEYWMFTLFNILIALVFSGLFVALESTALLVVYMVYMLAVTLPSLAVLVRRLHDTGRSGWFYFIGAIPIAGPFILLAFLCGDSKPEHNQYGPNPKMVAAA